MAHQVCRAGFANSLYANGGNRGSRWQELYGSCGDHHAVVRVSGTARRGRHPLGRTSTGRCSRSTTRGRRRSIGRLVSAIAGSRGSKRGNAWSSPVRMPGWVRSGPIRSARRLHMLEACGELSPDATTAQSRVAAGVFAVPPPSRAESTSASFGWRPGTAGEGVSSDRAAAAAAVISLVGATREPSSSTFRSSPCRRE